MTHLSVGLICPNPKCPAKTGGENPRTKIQKWGTYGKEERPRRYCTRCKKAFSETATLSRENFYRRRKPSSRAEAIFLYQQGNSFRQIAKELGVNTKSVSKWIGKFGVSRKVGRYSREFQSTASQDNQTRGAQEASVESNRRPSISEDLENEFRELSERAIKMDDKIKWKMIEKDRSDPDEE